MDLNEFAQAFEKHSTFMTEYGAGARVLGGILRKRKFNRKRYRLDGTKIDDIIHEHELNLGPLVVTHRSKNPNLLSGDEYELSVVLFYLFGMSNDKDLLIKLKAGPSLAFIKTMLATVPSAGLAAMIADLDLSARAGLRINISRLMKEINKNPEDEDDIGREDVDLS